MSEPAEPAPPLAAWTLLAVAWCIVLLWFREADNDLWHQLSYGAHWALTGELQRREVFSFLPSLPEPIYHEWGCGIVVWLLVRVFGSAGLLLWKLLTGGIAVGVPLWLARRAGAPHGALLLLAPLVAWCVLPAYMPTVRPHAITFAAFALLLAIVDSLRRGGGWWLVGAGGALMLFWVNTHGGFVAGYGLIGVFALASWRDAGARNRLIALGAVCFAVSFANPWTWRFWPHHLMALTHKRPLIPEWQAIEPFAWDAFSGFRVLAVATAAALAAAWRRTSGRDLALLAMLGIVAVLPFSARRHAPFFAIVAVVALAPYLRALSEAAASRARVAPERLRAAFMAYGGALALAAAVLLGPSLAFSVRAPVGLFPVREADLLQHANLKGNAAVPFAWGAYLGWRLHPAVKVSIDSRYEVAFPESTFLLNYNFSNRISEDWDRLLKEHEVDFVILDLHGERLRPEHLAPLGFRTVFEDPGTSALLVHERRFAEFAAAMEGVSLETLPTQDPFDLRLAERWRDGE